MLKFVSNSKTEILEQKHAKPSGHVELESKYRNTEETLHTQKHTKIYFSVD